MLHKGQARFPLLIALVLLTGLALSQDAPPPLLSWAAPSTGAQWGGSVFNSQNSLAAAGLPAGAITAAFSSCPPGWVCVASPPSIGHGGTDASYTISAVIIAPQGSAGTATVRASAADGAITADWAISVSPAAEEQPPAEQPTAGFAEISSCREISSNAKLTQDIFAPPSPEDELMPCITLAPGLQQKSVLDCAGHSITGTGTGIGIFYADNTDNGWEIRNCRISNFGYGMHTESDNLTVRNVDVTGSRIAWQAGGASPIAAIDSRFSNSETGIIFYYTLPTVFTNVTVEGISGYPFIFEGIAGDQISENRIANLTSEKRGLVKGSRAFEITGSSLGGLDFESGSAESNRVQYVPRQAQGGS
ncbi:MAG: right-handed parallel beta-helix repeat-containing protein [Candidatus Micrarchaeia archaeon]